MGHAGVLGPDETGVGGYGLPHTLDGAVRLSLELTSDDLTQALAQGVRLLAKLLARLTPTVWEDEQTVAGDYRGGDNPRHVEETRRCDGDDDGPDTDGPYLERSGLGDGALEGERQFLGLALPVVALHHVLGVLADGLDEPAAVVLETVAHLPDQTLVVIGLTAAIDVLDDHAPLLEVPVDHPVYELIHPLVHELLGVCDDLPLETLAHLLLAEELADVGEADVLLQPAVAPLVHLQDYVLDLGGPEVLFEEGQALVHRSPVTPVQLVDHPEWALHLQPDPSTFIEQVRDVAFELCEAARLHEGVTLHGVRCRLGLASKESRDGKDRGRQAESRTYAAVHKGANLLDLRFVGQEVGLVDDEQDLLPPVADELEVPALALSERPLGGGDEQHQVTPRHEAPGKLLVVADDRVGPRRIDDGNLTQELIGIPLLQNPVSAPFLGGLVGVTQ